MPASGPSLNGIAAIKAFTSSQLANRTILWDSSVYNAAKPYVYNSTSTATADDNLILMPSDNPAAGRWERNVVAGGGVTVDSVIATSLPSQPFGTPNFPSLRPTAAPTTIGQTIFVYRRYTGTFVTIFAQSIEMVINRAAYFTAIGLTAGDWTTDRSGLVDIEYLTDNGSPINSNPFLSATNDLKIEPDYAGQRLIFRAATSANTFYGGEQSRVVTFDTGLPVFGSAVHWWEWG